MHAEALLRYLVPDARILTQAMRERLRRNRKADWGLRVSPFLFSFSVGVMRGGRFGAQGRGLFFLFLAGGPDGAGGLLIAEDGSERDRSGLQQALARIMRSLA